MYARMLSSSTSQRCFNISRLFLLQRLFTFSRIHIQKMEANLIHRDETLLFLFRAFILDQAEDFAESFDFHHRGMDLEKVPSP
jgi:hypothetical protein